ncbi:MAG: hypothetical protein K2G93_06870, partial [Rikenella sp.]|nr:hypothetical protein [Rikenella sp.]
MSARILTRRVGRPAALPLRRAGAARHSNQAASTLSFRGLRTVDAYLFLPGRPLGQTRVGSRAERHLLIPGGNGAAGHPNLVCRARKMSQPKLKWEASVLPVGIVDD